MTNTHQTTGDVKQAGRSRPGARRSKRNTATAQQTKAAPADPAEDKITTLEIASYEGGRKTLSVVARISMETAVKVLAFSNDLSKA